MNSIPQRALSAALSAIDRAYLLELSLRGVDLGNRVEVVGRPHVYSHGGRIILGDDVRLWSRDREYISQNQAVRLFVATPEARIEIGARTSLNGVSICASARVSIGQDCHLAAGTTIFDTHGHAHDHDQRIAGTRDEPQAVVIGDRVWIGLRVIVLKGVTIGDGAIVGAGSVVTRDLPPDSLCAGNPARVIRLL